MDEQFGMRMTINCEPVGAPCKDSSHAQMWELDHEEGRELKNWCLWPVVLEKTLENTLDNKEIKPVHPKGNQPWIFLGQSDAKAEAPILWPSDVKSWLIGIDPDAGEGWGQEEKGTTEDEMVGWHHQLNGHELGQTPRDSEGHRSLACCSPRGHKQLDTTWQLNNKSTLAECGIPVFHTTLPLRRQGWL